MKLSRDEAIDRAAALAALSPSANANPRVGCVIVGADGRVLAEGYHRGAGTWHAEAAAIQEAIAAGIQVRGATAYVTLEPCAHQGRTPSCARALARSGVKRVVLGQRDPNAQAAGGSEILRAAGVEVEQDPRLARASEALNPSWTFAMTHDRPFVRWKFATTLDGFSAAPDDSSQWITGEAARADVKRLREEHGAILVGTGTALADDPHLTVRETDGTPTPWQPLRVIMGERPVPADARALDASGPSLVLATHDIDEALARLSDRGIHSVWLEGGPTLAAAFLDAGVIDEIVAYVAPALLGSGRSALGDLGATSIADLRRFDLVDVTTLTSDDGQRDLRLTLRPQTTQER